MPVRLHHSRDMLYTASSSKQAIELAKLTAVWYMESDEIFSQMLNFCNFLKTKQKVQKFSCSISNAVFINTEIIGINCLYHLQDFYNFFYASKGLNTLKSIV